MSQDATKIGATMQNFFAGSAGAQISELLNKAGLYKLLWDGQVGCFLRDEVNVQDEYKICSKYLI